MKIENKHLLLYAVTDDTWLNGRELCEDVRKAILGGVTMVQLRMKNASYDEFLAEAFKVKAVCKEFNVPFIINDNVDIAVACDADGVHIGQSDLNAIVVREKIGRTKIIGVSTQNVLQAILAEKIGADYLGVGAVFETGTKLDAKPVPHSEVAKICDAVSIPVCAIGGIKKDNILELKGNHLSGIAVVSAIFAADDILNECKELTEITREMVAK